MLEYNLYIRVPRNQKSHIRLIWVEPHQVLLLLAVCSMIKYSKLHSAFGRYYISHNIVHLKVENFTAKNKPKTLLRNSHTYAAKLRSWRIECFCFEAMHAVQYKAVVYTIIYMCSKHSPLIEFTILSKRRMCVLGMALCFRSRISFLANIQGKFLLSRNNVFFFSKSFCFFKSVQGPRAHTVTLNQSCEKIKKLYFEIARTTQKHTPLIC